MAYTWPQDRDDYIPKEDGMSDRDDHSDSLKYNTPDGYHRTDHVNYDKDLDWKRDLTPERETRGGSRERERMEEEKHYRPPSREESPFSAQDSLHSEPVSELRRNHVDRRAPLRNENSYPIRRRRKMSNASVDSNMTDTSLRDVYRKVRVDSIDSTISIDSYGRPRTRSRRLSFAEGRRLRVALEKTQEEADKRIERIKSEEKREMYRRNRDRAKKLGRRRDEREDEVLAEDLRKGDVVLIDRGVGVVRWVGKLHFITPRSDYWAGVELKETRGKNDGKIKGKRYFTCKAGQGVFVSSVTKQVCPEELLEQLAIQRQKCKRVKKKVDSHRREQFQNDVLRNQVKTMRREITKLERNKVGNIADAVGNKMENFLNLLADHLHPGSGDRGRASSKSLRVLGLPPSWTKDGQILGWLYDKKRKQRLSSKEDPIFSEQSVCAAMVWLVRTLQGELKSLRRQNDRYRTQGGYDSDEGSE